jgi:hypothetical protein
MHRIRLGDFTISQTSCKLITLSFPAGPSIKTKKKSLALVEDQTILTERPPLVGETSANPLYFLYYLDSHGVKLTPCLKEIGSPVQKLIEMRK